MKLSHPFCSALYAFANEGPYGIQLIDASLLTIHLNFATCSCLFVKTWIDICSPHYLECVSHHKDCRSLTLDANNTSTHTLGNLELSIPWLFVGGTHSCHELGDMLSRHLFITGNERRM